MNNEKSKQSAKSELPTKLQFGMDTIGMWFSTIVLFVVLATGIVIYRDANNEIRMTSNGAMFTPVPRLR